MKRALTIEQTELLPPPLKWAGGKRWLVPTLRALYAPHAHRRLVEPFVGGMAVALGLRPRQALLNDVNPHVINFYTHLKRGLQISTPMRNDRAFFLRKRTRFNDLIRADSLRSEESAQLFYYMNRTAFNGLCRFNRSGEFNVPFGRYSKIHYTRDFSPYAALLKRWRFSCGDFEDLAITKNDFVYVDPPYDVEFTTYSAGGFSWDDQVRLVEWLCSLPCPVVASNQATRRILKLYRDAGFAVRTLPAPRRISCTGDRTPAAEMLATRSTLF